MDKIKFRVLLGVGYQALGFPLDVFASLQKPVTIFKILFHGICQIIIIFYPKFAKLYGKQA